MFAFYAIFLPRIKKYNNPIVLSLFRNYTKTPLHVQRGNSKKREGTCTLINSQDDGGGGGSHEYKVNDYPDDVREK